MMTVSARVRAPMTSVRMARFDRVFAVREKCRGLDDIIERHADLRELRFDVSPNEPALLGEGARHGAVARHRHLAAEISKACRAADLDDLRMADGGLRSVGGVVRCDFHMCNILSSTNFVR